MKQKVRVQLSPTSDVIMLAREMTLESDWSNVSASYLNRMLALGKMKPPLIQPARSTSTAPIQVALLNKYDYQTSKHGLCVENSEPLNAPYLTTKVLAFK